MIPLRYISVWRLCSRATEGKSESWSLGIWGKKQRQKGPVNGDDLVAFFT